MCATKSLLKVPGLKYSLVAADCISTEKQTVSGCYSNGLAQGFHLTSCGAFLGLFFENHYIILRGKSQCIWRGLRGVIKGRSEKVLVLGAVSEAKIF